MQTEPGSDRIAVSADNVDDAVWKTRLCQDLAEPERCSGRQLARLDNASAACGEGVGEFLAHDQEREIPRSDHADNADWFADDQAEHRRTQCVVTVSINV